MKLFRWVEKQCLHKTGYFSKVNATQTACKIENKQVSYTETRPNACTQK